MSNRIKILSDQKNSESRALLLWFSLWRLGKGEMLYSFVDASGCSRRRRAVASLLLSLLCINFLGQLGGEDS